MINATPHSPSASGPTPSFDEVVAKINKAPVGASGGYSPKPKSKKSGRNLGFILAGIILLIVGVAGYFISQNLTTEQDVRQQASVGVKTPGCGTACTTNANCPNAHSCSDGKCVLTECTRAGVQCDAEKCVRTNVANCSLNFVALDVNNFVCDKKAFRDEFSNSPGTYQLLQEQTAFAPGDVVVFRIRLTNNSSNPTTISVSDVLTAANLNNVTFMDSNCGADAYNATTKTLTCPAVSVAANGNVDRIFRVKVNSDTPNNTVITNTATATAGTSTVTCNVPVTISSTPPSPSPSPSPTYACDSTCTSDAQCQTVNANYVCSSAQGNRCRLRDNPTSSTCATQTYTCNGACTTNEQCRTANSSYICHEGACRLDSNPTATNCQPPTTTVVGCNSTCVTNSDCASSSHICADTTDGRRCRLATNVESASCTPPVTVASTPTPTPQPVQPESLPVAGTQDTIKYVLGGAAAVILGAAALLYL